MNTAALLKRSFGPSAVLTPAINAEAPNEIERPQVKAILARPLAIRLASPILGNAYEGALLPFGSPLLGATSVRAPAVTEITAACQGSRSVHALRANLTKRATLTFPQLAGPFPLVHSLL